ncbi:MAG: GFA family protein [Pseudomonadota bacterium]
MSREITGGCLCGAVRYRCTDEPQSMGICQCERCQRQSGSSYLIATVFSKEAVSLDGELTTYEARDESGAALYRHFCPRCGSNVMITLDRYPEIRSMMGGTLDDKSVLQPTFSLWTSKGQPWLKLPPEIELHEEYPDGAVA